MFARTFIALPPISQHDPLFMFCYFTWAIVLTSCSITPNSTVGLSHVGYTWWAPPPATPRPSSSPTWSSSHQLNSLSLPLSSIPGKTFIRKYCLSKKTIVSQVQTISILVSRPSFYTFQLIPIQWYYLCPWQIHIHLRSDNSSLWFIVPSLGWCFVGCSFALQIGLLLLKQLLSTNIDLLG